MLHVDVHNFARYFVHVAHLRVPVNVHADVDVDVQGHVTVHVLCTW
jgi:hypothetical protein